jgi:recombination protein RecA
MVKFKTEFVKGFVKDMDKVGIDIGAAEPPRYWFSTGNYALNKTISGSFLKGIPQGRIVCFAGPSGSGKTFITCNCIREAQKEGIFAVVGDSEHALDAVFASKIGVDVSEDMFIHADLDTIPQAQKYVSSFLKSYEKEYGIGDPNAPKVVIVIDSLDMLMTETEEENFDKGVLKGDQGQRSKQMKSVLRQFVHAIKHQNISMIVTHQVYKNQDVMNGEGVWIVNDAVKYSLSQITLLTKLKLRGDTPSDVQGIRMKCEGYKTRFCRPFMSVTIEVPYETGMDSYNGLLEAAVGLGVVEQNGSWYKFGEEKFQSKNFNQFAPDILAQCETLTDAFLQVKLGDNEVVDMSSGESSKKKRLKKAEEE